MDHPLISVIIPVYNVDKYLRQCLDSVINQTYKNIEILLIDDGSTDDSGKICDEYAGNDARITVIHKENGGLSDARNTGIESMHGQYVSFVDSDDYIDLHYIETLTNAAVSTKSDVIMASYIKVSDNYIDRGSKCKAGKSIEQFSGIDAKLSMLYRKKLTMYSPGKLYHAALFDKVRFPYGRIFEDMVTTWEIMKLVNAVEYVDEPLYFYRQRSGSTVNTKYSHRKMDQVFMAKDILDEVCNDRQLYKAAVSLYFFALSDIYAQIDKNSADDWKFLEGELKKYLSIVKEDKNNSASLRLLAFWGGIHIRLIRMIGRIYKRCKSERLKIFGSI